MWATVDADGHIVRTHSREESARLNADGLTVIEAPDEVATSANCWRLTGRKWVQLSQPISFRKRPANYAEARRAAYAEALETDRQLEAIVEALAVILEGKPTPPKLAALLNDIAAVKAQHPKP